MSKQCYWSSEARRRDWSVDSLRLLALPCHKRSRRDSIKSPSLLQRFASMFVSVHHGPRGGSAVPDTFISLRLVSNLSSVLLLSFTSSPFAGFSPPFFIVPSSIYWLLTAYRNPICFHFLLSPSGSTLSPRLCESSSISARTWHRSINQSCDNQASWRHAWFN